MISVPERGIYLASRSPRRRELLSQIGVRYHLLLFRDRPGEQADVDESTLGGETPAAYVEELRVETARRLLEDTDLTVAAVATRVGFTHAETLHRAFRRRVGTTPDSYRQHFGRRAS